MRDIREELRARRAAVMGSYADAMHRFQVQNDHLLRERREAVEQFETEKATLDAMIAMEERRLAGDQPAAPLPTSSLRDFLVTTVQAASGSLDKELLRAAAEGAGFREGGRAFNMTLQNVANSGAIRKTLNGDFVDGRSARNGTTAEVLMSPN